MERPARRATFEEVVAEHYPALVRRLTAVLGDQEAGRDLAQEAYLRAFRAWDRFDGADPHAWLYTIGLRLALNERKRRMRWSALLGRHRSEPATVTTADPDLHRALARLPRQQRAALMLSAVDGYTQREIAAMLEVPPGTVASWLARAKAQLREVLTDG